MQVTHQAVLISDGNVSFAAFVYDNSTVGIATAFKGNKLAGFDAGDGIRSATIHNPSPDLSSLQQLETVNIFRIDGTYVYKLNLIPTSELPFAHHKLIHFVPFYKSQTFTYIYD